MSPRLPRAAGPAIGLAGLSLLASGALGATGDLTSQACVQDNDTGTDACTTSVDGLNGAEPVVASADRKSVYVAGGLDDAVVRFDRVAASGDLVPRGCVDDDDTGPETCAHIAAGLDFPRALALSPDGGSLYAATAIDDAVVRFNRAADGSLVPAGCVDDEDSGPDTCAQTAPGLDEARGIAVSPDGDSVYAVSQTDNAIVHLVRTPATGALQFRACIDDNDTGPDGCAIDTDGLAGASGVAVSPDGRSVYVGALIDHAVVAFERNPANGALTPLGCIDDNDNGADGCAADGDGLNGATDVQVSRDGRSVYAASQFDHAVVRFSRNPANGALLHRGCVQDNDSGIDGCAQDGDGLAGAIALAISPDDRSVYVSGFGDDAIARLRRDPASGILTPLGCLDDNDTGSEECAESADGLNAVFGIAATLDGRSLYAAARDDRALAAFVRDDSTPPETSILKGPKRKTRKRSAKLAFRSSEPLSKFRCKLDRAKYRSCPSPRRYRGLAPGRHTFKVRGIDPSGNQDQTPAKRHWKVKR